MKYLKCNRLLNNMQINVSRKITYNSFLLMILQDTKHRFISIQFYESSVIQQNEK